MKSASLYLLFPSIQPARNLLCCCLLELGHVLLVCVCVLCALLCASVHVSAPGTDEPRICMGLGDIPVVIKYRRLAELCFANAGSIVTSMCLCGTTCRHSTRK